MPEEFVVGDDQHTRISDGKYQPSHEGYSPVHKINSGFFHPAYPGATVDVYDRSGQIIFHSLNYDRDWDETFKGKPLAIGTYYYVINPRNGKGVFSGSITIIR